MRAPGGKLFVADIGHGNSSGGSGSTQAGCARRSGPSGAHAASRAIEWPAPRVKQSLERDEVHRRELTDAAVQALDRERLRSAQG